MFMRSFLLGFLLIFFSCSSPERKISSVSSIESGCHQILSSIINQSEKEIFDNITVDKALEKEWFTQFDFDQIPESKAFAAFLKNSEMPEIDQMALTIAKKQNPDLPEELIVRKIKALQGFCL